VANYSGVRKNHVFCLSLGISQKRCEIDGSLHLRFNNLVYNCLIPELTAPVNARSVSDSWPSCFSF